MLKTRYFYIVLTFTILGTLLRLNNYSRTPSWNECKDEIHYAWTGLTWITTGIPKSWSYLSAYKNVTNIKLWGEDWRMVSPMLEKPPLYSFLSGLTVLTAGQNEIDKVRISTIRLLPIALSAITIFLTGLLAMQVFSPATGILASLLYSIVPTMVLSNRLSVTENLLTPLVLLSLYLIIKSIPKKNVILERGKYGLPSDRIPSESRIPTGSYQSLAIFSARSLQDDKITLVLAFLSGLVLLTKQSGIALVFTLAFLFLITKQYKNLLIYLLIAFGIGLIYPLIAIALDRQLFFSLTSEARRIGIQGGLPILIQTILARPLITTEKLFPDGSMLLGYILLLSSPAWLFSSGSIKQEKSTSWKKFVFIMFPFFYLCYLALTITGAENIGSGQAFWGWYVYPLFPFMIILVAECFVRLWKNIPIFSTLPTHSTYSTFSLLFLLYLTLGSSSVRFLFLFVPRQFHYRWQWLMLVIFGILCGSFFLNKPGFRKIILISLFLFYLTINIFTDIHMSQFYPSLPQP